MKTFIAEQIEIAEIELVSNGYPVTQSGAAQYAKKLWARCGRAAKNRSRSCYSRKAGNLSR